MRENQALRAGLALLFLGLCHCGPKGECTGTVGGHAVKAQIDGDSDLLITYPPENPNRMVRVALMQLVYDDGLRLDVRVDLPGERDPTAIPFGSGAESQSGGGRVSLFRVRSPQDAPAVHSGVFTVEQPSTTNVQGSFQVRFEDESELSCTFDVSGKNCIYEDQPPSSGPVPSPPNDPCAGSH